LQVELDIPKIQGEVHRDLLYQQLYATDASVYRALPKGVFFPKDASDIQAIIEWAYEHGEPIIPRTAGTSLAGQCVGEGWVVDVSKHLTNVGSIDSENRTVWVEPGVIRDELNRQLRPDGLWFAPNTSTSNRCMIGGMVGNNSSGSTSIKYGVTRDKVLRMEGFLSDGTPVEFGPLYPDELRAKTELNTLEGEIYRHLLMRFSDSSLQADIGNSYPTPAIHRRNNGYAIDDLIQMAPFNPQGPPLNLCRMIAGSEGTLFFATRIQLQLDPLPPSESLLLCPHFHSIGASMKAVSAIMKKHPDACELMDRVVLDCTRENRKYLPYRAFIQGNPEAVLMVELRADSPELLQHKSDEMLAVLRTETEAYAFPALQNEEMTGAWELRKAGLGLLSNVKGDAKPVACIEDTAVEIDRLPDYIAEFEALMKSFDQQAVYYAHAGAGELHLRPILNLKTSSGRWAFRQISEASARLVKAYQGSLAGEHGVGRVRGEFLKEFIGEAMYLLLCEIKEVWDPKGIFNPGKLVHTPAMDVQLRYEVDRDEPSFTSVISFDADGGILRHLERCNGTALCRKTHWEGGTMCPSYMATLDEKDSTRGRANVLRELFTSTEPALQTTQAKEALNLCLSCKACQSECPSNIDMAVLKSETLHLHYQSHRRPLRDYIFGQYARFAFPATRFAGAVNLLNKSPLGTLTKKLLGVSPNRPLPEFAPARKWPASLTVPSALKEVVLYLDEFTQTETPTLVDSAVRVLGALGYTVHLPKVHPSARPEISKGFLTRAQKLAEKNVLALHPFAERTIPILGIEPSAILGFSDEYPNLVRPAFRDRALQLAQMSKTIETFLLEEWEAGNWTDASFDDTKRHLLLHTHCHQKARGVHTHTATLMGIPKGHHVRHLDAGCCGMAGSFGYEKEHFNTSMAIANQRLFPEIQKALESTLIVAPGTSCRSQIFDGLHAKALHPIQILDRALKTP